VAPTRVVGLTSGVTAIAAGMFHTCAVVDQGVRCWGYNFSGQLGNKSRISSPVPLPVEGLTHGVSAVAAGGHPNQTPSSGHSCALVGGTMRCWGSNYLGQLGSGVDRKDALVPNPPITFE